MLNVDESFSKKFRLEEFALKTVGGSWIISLRPQQITLGSLVLTLNRKCPKLSLITENEAKGLGLAFETIESMLANTFKPDKLNYLSLMMLDEQVHFHVIPRYEQKVFFDGSKFVDTDWPKPPSLSPINFDDNKLYKLLDLFK